MRVLTYVNDGTDDELKMVAVNGAIGDYLVWWQPETDPLEIIALAVTQAQAGAAIIFGHRQNLVDGVIYRLGRAVGEKIIPSIAQIKSATTGFICLTRHAINTILKVSTPTRAFWISVINTHLPISYLDYQPLRAVRKSFRGGLYRAFHLIVFTSQKPLRFITFLGFGASFFTFAFALYSLVIRFFMDRIVQGWTTTMLVISLSFMLLFVMLGFITEYLSRILDVVENRQNFTLADEQTSYVMLAQDRLNVLTESEHSRKPSEENNA